MKLSNIIGQNLDEKYRIESEIGRGGMGAVYLATHLGTERPVAVKIIAPQFMKRAEFVERFRREARAAGRLRHPNVVDVTDFGFAHTDDGEVAYLVMEYLDGCTLGEILEEEKRLPVGWTLDIIEQISSAVHEAHQQGIIHRDLKPDNIWLEPNQRGGYTVKVLDFGIAKVDGHFESENDAVSVETELLERNVRETIAQESKNDTFHDGAGVTNAAVNSTFSAAAAGSTAVLEGETMIQPIEALAESGTDADSIGTRIIGAETEDPRVSGESGPGIIRTLTTDTNLTRVGAVLGTPLYMSPEQCRGEKLDARSDVYSLGVIAYQMLSGSTPFDGNYRDVMEAHKNAPVPPLNAKKVRRKLKHIIEQALAKDPADRPETAEAFAIGLRSRADGIFGLLRQAAMIYTEHMPKFIFLSTFFWLPVLLATVLLVTVNFLSISGNIPETLSNVLSGIFTLLIFFFTSLAAFFIVGTITWIVTQNLAVPLRPISLRAALRAARSKWKTFAATGLFTTILTIVAAGIVGLILLIPTLVIIWLIFGLEGPAPIFGAVFAAVGGMIAFFAISVAMMLLGPAVMMENVRGIKAIRRSIELIRRSPVTAFNAFVIMFLVPFVTASLISGVVNLTAKQIDPTLFEKDGAVISKTEDGETVIKPSEKESDIQISIGTGNKASVKVSDPKANVQMRLKHALLETMLQILLLPLQILTTSFTAIIVALLYLKTRQVGGESLQSLLYHFEESGRPRKHWQERVKRRLIQSGRISEKT